MFDYAAKAGNNLSKDPFLLSSEKRLSYEMMRNAGLTGAPFADSYNHEKNARLPLGQRRSVTLKTLVGRFIVALLGGVALVGPMLIMVLHNDQTTKLATTSVAVFLVAAFVATIRELRRRLLSVSWRRMLRCWWCLWERISSSMSEH